MRNNIKKYNLKIIIRRIIKMVLSIFWLFPIRDKNVLFISYGGQQYSCNTKYISEYLSSNNDNSLNIIWVFKEPSNFELLKNKNYKIVKYGSLGYLKDILTAKIIITNNSISSYLPIRKGQVVINTWHGGGAYKKVVPDENIRARKTIKETAKVFDIFVSTCKKNSELMIKETFGHSGKIFEVGFPRNDIFFKDTQDIKRKIYKHFDFKIDDKLVLYAPTFREEVSEDTYDIDTKGLKLALEKRFGGNWILMVRAHHSIKNKFDFENNKNSVCDATGYEDMQELLCSADLLITDYSSCIWDFSLMYKPSILFAKDLDSYVKERDFYVPIERWHFPIIKSNKELIDYIGNFKEEENRRNIERHLQEFGSFETGEATEIIADEIKKILDE